MLLNDSVEEILERVGDGPGRTMSMRSIVRKIDQKQKEILRRFGNQNDDVAVMDLLEGVSEYPLPCPPGAITSVYVNNQRIPFRERNDYTKQSYYYLLDGTIGFFLYGQINPTGTIERGIKIFHRHIPETLTVDMLDAEPEIEEPYRMLLVYGVLIDIAEPNMIAKYKQDYEEMLSDYIHSTRDPESTAISEVYPI
jgi:hypothetical protein